MDTKSLQRGNNTKMQEVLNKTQDNKQLTKTPDLVSKMGRGYHWLSVSKNKTNWHRTRQDADYIYTHGDG